MFRRFHGDYYMAAVLIILLVSGAVNAQSPTEVPTLAPTKATGDDDSINLNAGEALKYWGVYLTVFGGLYIITACLDKTKYMDELVDKMTEAAYAQVRDELLADSLTAKEVVNLEKKEEKGCIEKCCQCNCLSSNCCCCCGNSAKVTAEAEAKKKYHRSFRVALLKKRLYYGLKVTDLPMEGSWFASCIRSFCADNKQVDKLYFILNNHTIISMFSAEREHPTSRAEKRMDFFIQHALALMFSCLFVNSGLDFSLAFLLNVFICIPVIQITKLIFYLLTSCPCLECHSGNCCITSCQNGLIWIGESMGRIIFFACIFIYFAAAAFSYRADNYSSLVKYCYQVFVLSQVQEVILALLMFTDRYWKVRLFCIPIITMGEWYVEKMKHFSVDVLSKENLESFTIIPILFVIFYSKNDISYKVVEKVDTTTLPVGTPEPAKNQIEMANLQQYQQQQLQQQQHFLMQPGMQQSQLQFTPQQQYTPQQHQNMIQQQQYPQQQQGLSQQYPQNQQYHQHMQIGVQSETINR